MKGVIVGSSVNDGGHLSLARAIRIWGENFRLSQNTYFTHSTYFRPKRFVVKPSVPASDLQNTVAELQSASVETGLHGVQVYIDAQRYCIKCSSKSQ